jgi:hypothetical protein
MPVKAKLLAQRRAPKHAEALARRAVRLAETSDALNRAAKANLDLAEVLGIIGHAEGMAEALRTALGLYGRKGNAVGAARAKALLDEYALV